MAVSIGLSVASAFAGEGTVAVTPEVASMLNAADVMMSKLGASVAEGVLKLAEGSAPREVLRQVAAAPITAAQHALIELSMKTWVATTSGMTTIESLIAQGKRWIRQRFWVAYVNPLQLIHCRTY